jgi:hypothetical protein
MTADVIDLPTVPTTVDTFIQAVEVWVPDAEGSLLQVGSAWYGAARRFGAMSQSMVFGRGEGLPGQAWEAGRPVVLRNFAGSTFRRTQAAHADGITSGIAWPVFAGTALKAVVLIFCGDAGNRVGAIELWRKAEQARELLLDDGYYGGTAEVFEFLSRRTAFRKGTGLPGMAWDSGLPVFLPDLGRGARFLRADSAQKVGINRGFAIPCECPGDEEFVLAFLSALATPLVRRFEVWVPGPLGPVRSEGFCEIEGELATSVTAAPDVVSAALHTGVPALEAAADAGFSTRVALPVHRHGEPAAVVCWSF